MIFGSTVDTDLRQSTEVSMGYGLCFATETDTHSATVQSSSAMGGVFQTAEGSFFRAVCTPPYSGAPTGVQG